MYGVPWSRPEYVRLEDPAAVGARDAATASYSHGYLDEEWAARRAMELSYSYRGGEGGGDDDPVTARSLPTRRPPVALFLPYSSLWHFFHLPTGKVAVFFF